MAQKTIAFNRATLAKAHLAVIKIFAQANERPVIMLVLAARIIQTQAKMTATPLDKILEKVTVFAKQLESNEPLDDIETL